VKGIYSYTPATTHVSAVYNVISILLFRFMLQVMQFPTINVSYFRISTVQNKGHAVAQRLRHCATNRKVAGSIPVGFIGIFY
jgi:hypothetical protein